MHHLRTKDNVFTDDIQKIAFYCEGKMYSALSQNPANFVYMWPKFLEGNLTKGYP